MSPSHNALRLALLHCGPKRCGCVYGRRHRLLIRGNFAWADSGCGAPYLLQIWDKAEAVDMSRYENSDYAVLLRKFFRLIMKEGRSTNHTPELIGS